MISCSFTFTNLQTHQYAYEAAVKMIKALLIKEAIGSKFIEENDRIVEFLKSDKGLD